MSDPSATVPGQRVPDELVTAILRRAREALTAAGVDPRTAEHDSRVLLAQAMGVPPTALLVRSGVDAASSRRFEALITRRASRVPLQHLTGQAYFRRVSLEVGAGVFVPRPETELLAGWAVEQIQRLRTDRPDEPPVAVDLCTGSGAIAAALAEETAAPSQSPAVRQYAVELSEQAAGYAARNLAGRGVDLRVGDIAEAFPELNGQVDVVTANPPYVPLDAWESVAPEARDHDPELALFSGVDGLDAIRVVARVAARLLKPGGVFGCEHADAQGESAPRVFSASGHFAAVHDHTDLNGRPRFVTGRRI